MGRSINNFYVPFFSSFSFVLYDIHKNTFVGCVNSHTKRIILNSSNLIFQLEQWLVKVEDIERKVKRLKLEDNFV